MNKKQDDNWKPIGAIASQLVQKLEKQFERECLEDGIDARKQYQPQLPLPRK